MPKESKVEQAKRDGRHLRGTIAETLRHGRRPTSAATTSPCSSSTAPTSRTTATRGGSRDEGAEKAFSFMVRVALPAGVLDAGQYLALEEVADRYANGTLRVTTRQGFQFHGVLKRGLKADHRRGESPAHDDAGGLRRRLPQRDGLPRAGGRRGARRGARGGPRHRRAAAPRLQGVSRDLARRRAAGLHRGGGALLRRRLPAAEVQDRRGALDRQLRGHLVAGRGAGRDRGRPEHPRVQRAGGRRARHDPPQGRHRRPARPAARLRRSRSTRSRRCASSPRSSATTATAPTGGTPGSSTWSPSGASRSSGPSSSAGRSSRSAPAVELPALPYHDHLGRHRQPDGRWFYGVFVQSGRITDTGSHRLKTALHEIVTRFRPGRAAHRTAERAAHRPRRRRGEGGRDASCGSTASPRRRSCPRRAGSRWPAPRSPPAAWRSPSRSGRCRRSSTGSRPSSTALGLRDEPLTIRMTGCPNGCARPYTADIAFVGRSLGLYNVYVGGGLGGDRVVDLFRADVRLGGAARGGAAAAGALGVGALAGRGAERLLPAADRPDRAADLDHRTRGAHRGAGGPGGGIVSGGALVLAAHGSRRDPAANALVRRLAQAVRERRLFDEVAVAFHQGEPGFDAVLDELGVGGGHGGAGDDERRATTPTWCCPRRWPATGAIAERPAAADPAGRLAPGHRAAGGAAGERAAAGARALARSETTLLLAGHGTRRHAASRDTTLQLAETLRRRGVAGDGGRGVPRRRARAPRGARPPRATGPVLVLPFLIGGGAHAADDIPRAHRPGAGRDSARRPGGRAPGRGGPRGGHASGHRGRDRGSRPPASAAAAAAGPAGRAPGARRRPARCTWSAAARAIPDSSPRAGSSCCGGPTSWCTTA